MGCVSFSNNHYLSKYNNNSRFSHRDVKFFLNLRIKSFRGSLSPVLLVNLTFQKYLIFNCLSVNFIGKELKAFYYFFKWNWVNSLLLKTYLTSFFSKEFNIFFLGVIYFYHFNTFSFSVKPYNLIKFNSAWSSLLLMKSSLEVGFYKFIENLYFILYYNKLYLMCKTKPCTFVAAKSILPEGKLLLQDGISFSDYIYKFINSLMRSGKKGKAISLYLDFIYLHKIFNLDKKEIYLLGDVISSISPKFKLINIKYRGRNRSVPKLINKSKSLALGINLFVSGVKSRKERSMLEKLKSELFDIYSLKGIAFKLKHANYKQGFSNRSLLFRRSANRRKRKLLKFQSDQLFIG